MFAFKLRYFEMVVLNATHSGVCFRISRISGVMSRCSCNFVKYFSTNRINHRYIAYGCANISQSQICTRHLVRNSDFFVRRGLLLSPCHTSIHHPALCRDFCGNVVPMRTSTWRPENTVWGKRHDGNTGLMVNSVRWTSSNSHISDEYDDEEDEDIEDPTVDELLEDSEFNKGMREYYSVPGLGQRVFVVQPVTRSVWLGRSNTTSELQLEESLALISALPKWEVVAKEIVRIKRPQSKYLFEPGQMEELTRTVGRSLGITAVFVSINLLTRYQLNALQKRWKVPVFDRYSLVLLIFKEYARTKEAKLQVALAEIPVIRSRLDRIQILMNAAVLRRREQKIYKALEELKKQRGIIRKQRLKRKMPTVAVVGYTNAGKTTLIKALTNDVSLEPENRLFATLDITAHAGLLPNRMRAVYMDTVGFMSNIPVSLFNAFSATLEDAALADVVVHIRDISHPDTVAQKENVLTTIRPMLTTIQMDTIIEVCNKVDKLDRLDGVDSGCYGISAVTGEGLGPLRLAIQARLLENTDYLEKRFRIPLDGDHLRWLYKEATVVSSEMDSSNESLVVDIIISKDMYAKFSALFGGAKKQTATR